MALGGGGWVKRAADGAAVAAEVTAPGQGTDSSRASFSISAACINGPALSNTVSSAYSPGLGLCWACQLCSYRKAFCPFLRAVPLSFGGRSVSCGLTAC